MSTIRASVSAIHIPDLSPAELRSASDAELQARVRDIMFARDALRVELREVQLELERRGSAERAASVAAKLSPEDRAELLKLLQQDVTKPPAQTIEVETVSSAIGSRA